MTRLVKKLVGFSRESADTCRHVTLLFQLKHHKDTQNIKDIMY